MDIKKNKNKKRAFTLVEVTLAMVVIGTLAMITLPGLIANIKNHEYEQGAKKAHTLVSESFDSMKIDENSIFKVYNNDNVQPTSFRNVYAKYFGFVDLAGNVVSNVLRPPETFDNTYYPLNDTTVFVDNNLYNGGGFRARNGMLILIGKVPKPYETSESALIISVDIDGPNKGDNQLGRDVYSFEVMPSDNILPVGSKSTVENTTAFDYQNYCQTNISGNNLNGIACAFSALNTAEYMEHINDRLGGVNCCGSWNQATKTCLPTNGQIWNEVTKRCECPAGSYEGYKCACQTSENCCLTKEGNDVCCAVDCDKKEFNSKNGRWECQDGLSEGPDGKCNVCKEEQRLASGGCCPEGQSATKDKLSCKCNNPNKEMVNGQCLDPCPSGTARNQSGKCECSNGLIAVNDTLCCEETKEQDDYTMNLINNGTESSCTYDCGQGYYNKKDESCKCGETVEWKDGQCICNDKNAQWQTSNSVGACVCKEGYTKNTNNNLCVCANGSYKDDCGCSEAEGFVASSNGCICSIQRGFYANPSSVVNNGVKEHVCKCKNANKENSEGVCVCKANEHFVSDGNNGCTCDSANHYVFSGSTCICDIKNGFTENADGTCGCEGEIINGKCEQQCKNGAVLKSDGKTCECNLQYGSLDNDSCVCSGDLTIVKENGSYRCGCSGSGQIQEITKCIKKGGNCDGDGKYVNSLNICTCANGLIVENSTDVNCKCPVGWEDMDPNRRENVVIGNSSTMMIFCKPLFTCLCDDCVWKSNGGTYGTCYCGGSDGVIWNNKDQICTCYGAENDDVKVIYENEQYSCGCNSSKLTYSSSAGRCEQSKDGYLLDNYNDVEEAAALTGVYDYSLNDNINTSDWTPWGTKENPFKGTFDGQNKTITITGNISGDDYVGVFGYTEGNCKISNVNIVIEGNVSGKEYVGGVVGYNNCIIENVTLNGKSVSETSVSGNSHVGGFTGYNAGSISASSVDKVSVKVDETNSTSSMYFGGFVGSNYGQIYKSFVGNNVVVGNKGKYLGSLFGGFAGYMSSGSIHNSYTQVQEIDANEVAGGFIGYFVGGTIENVYSTVTDITVNHDKHNFMGNIATIYNNKNIYIRHSFYGVKDTEDEKTYSEKENIRLLGKKLSNLKDPVIYLCENWNGEPCIWAFDNNKEEYPKLLTSSGYGACIGKNCDYKGKFYNISDSCSDYDISQVSSDECAINLVVCKTGQHLNNENECVTCSARQVWDDEKKECSCPQDSQWSDVAHDCVCAEGGIYYEGLGCINCVEAGAKVSDDGKKCVCEKGTFDPDTPQCVASLCEKYEGIVVEDECTLLPSSLIYVKEEGKDDEVQCTTTTSIIITLPQDLYYMSECSQNYTTSDAKYIAGGGGDWTEGKTFEACNAECTGGTTIDMLMLGLKTFNPINNFSGTFEGTNSAIKNLTISSDVDDVGLFNIVNNGASIKNLYLDKFNITGKNNVGALAGVINISDSSKLSNVFVNRATLVGTGYVGGISGTLKIFGTAKTKTIIISDMASISKITTGETYAGGLFGLVDGELSTTTYTCRLKESYAITKFEKSDSTIDEIYSGGLVGKASDSNITLKKPNAAVSLYSCINSSCKSDIGTNNSDTISDGDVTSSDTCPSGWTTYTCAANSYPYFTNSMTASDTSVVNVNEFFGI